MLGSAPGNGRHLKSRFPYEPRTRSHHLGKMGLRLCWKEGAPFAEKELASSTRRFRKEQCERLIASIEGSARICICVDQTYFELGATSLFARCIIMQCQVPALLFLRWMVLLAQARLQFTPENARPRE